jgi:dTDP-4-amino-4,6-dideoxygalactose transaminase
MTGVSFLDLGAVQADLRADLDLAWKSVLAHGGFVGGPQVAAFEADFAAYCGATGCVGVANGTDALELILASLGIGPGDEVIVPANTFVATAEAVATVGATPRFVDVRPDTLLIDPVAVEAAVSPRTAAVIAVHLYGQMVGDGLERVAQRHGLPIIEDAAQAHGARFAGRRAGSIGVAAAFSFYPAKNLGALGDAGAVVSDDSDLLARIRSLANHGRSAGDRNIHQARGRNSRLDTLQAAVLAVKLQRLDQHNAARRAIMRRYRERLPPWCVPVAVDAAAEPVHHLAVVQVPDRERVCAALDRASIGWGIHYPVSCHRQPAFAQFSASLPVVEAAADHILSLPMTPTCTTDQIDRVCDILGGTRL